MISEFFRKQIIDHPDAWGTPVEVEGGIEIGWDIDNSNPPEDLGGVEVRQYQWGERADYFYTHEQTAVEDWPEMWGVGKATKFFGENIIGNDNALYTRVVVAGLQVAYKPGTEPDKRFGGEELLDLVADGNRIFFFTDAQTQVKKI